ncbi:hypothetical protein [Cellulosimicrobium funkei]|uniref:hypothetical protein n=1 Tax=Cellulosimicrobium funkei TaxID=264251 RepID=UPI003D730903
MSSKTGKTGGGRGSNQYGPHGTPVQRPATATHQPGGRGTLGTPGRDKRSANIVSSSRELDELPERTVVVSPTGTVFTRNPEGSWDSPYGLRALKSEVLLEPAMTSQPLRVAFRPDRDLVADAYEEGRRAAMAETGLTERWSETLAHDDAYEYSATSDCDGSNAQYKRRRPRMESDYFPWEPASEAEFRRAVDLTHGRHGEA